VGVQHATGVTPYSNHRVVTAMIFEVDPSLSNPDDLKHNKAAATAAEELYAESKSGPLTILPNSICYLPISQAVSEETLQSLASQAASLTHLPADEQAIRQHRFDQSAKLGQIEYIFDLGNWSPFFQPDGSDGKKYGTCLQILQYPFSRGSIHIRPGSPSTASDKPLIDPKYYEGSHGELDLEVMAHCALFADKIAKTEPLANIIRGRVYPPPSACTKEDMREWVVNQTITDWHPVGTCAMGGRRGIEGGVVDERLRVYGVKGLRVVDASIMPLQISGHSQATVYAIAEKGAAMILEDAGLAK
jgi:choline dehydrogenase-like flavoprotein